jgi:hypothetical protein
MLPTTHSPVLTPMPMSTWIVLPVAARGCQTDAALRRYLRWHKVRPSGPDGNRNLEAVVPARRGEPEAHGHPTARRPRSVC